MWLEDLTVGEWKGFAIKEISPMLLSKHIAIATFMLTTLIITSCVLLS